MPIERIYSNDPLITVCNSECGTADLYVDKNALIDGDAMRSKLDSTKAEVINEIDYKLNLVKNEYENQLQRTKVHISGGGRVTGSKIHGRRYKVTIPKRSFRNQTSIVSCPNRTK